MSTTTLDRPEMETWPDHFPPCCPPNDAVSTAGSYYYLVKTNPPTTDDMESALQRNVFKNADNCERAALSCWQTEQHLDELRDNVPNLRGRLSARFDLEPKHGRIKPTRAPGHFSLWLRREAHAVAHTLLSVL